MKGGEFATAKSTGWGAGAPRLCCVSATASMPSRSPLLGPREVEPSRWMGSSTPVPVFRCDFGFRAKPQRDAETHLLKQRPSSKAVCAGAGLGDGHWGGAGPRESPPGSASILSAVSVGVKGRSGAPPGLFVRRGEGPEGRIQDAGPNR